MSTENRSLLKKRSKSFLWRVGMMLVAVFIDFALTNLELFELSAQVTTILGLVLGEVSKYLNTPKGT